MGHGIAQKMEQRIRELVHDGLVELDLSPGDREVGLPVTGPFELAQGRAQAGEGPFERHQPGTAELLLDMLGRPAHGFGVRGQPPHGAVEEG